MQYKIQGDQVYTPVKKKLLGVNYTSWTASTDPKVIDAAKAFRANLYPKKFDVKKHVEHAFTFDGVDYYHYPNPLNMSPVRFGQYMLYMRESSINCSREYLLAYTDAIEKAINSSRIELSTVAVLTKEIRDRLKLSYIPDLVYKQASVLYFDENEDPDGYDFEYNRKKIARWKQKGAAFFLETPVRHLTMSQAISEENFTTYLMILNQQDMTSTETLLRKLSPSLNKKELLNYTELLSRVDSQYQRS